MPDLLDNETPHNDAAPVAAGKAVAKVIDGMDLGESYDLERSYIHWVVNHKNPDALPEELTGILPEPTTQLLRVDVVSHTTEQEIVGGTRTSVRVRTPVDILVRKRMDDAVLEGATGRIQVEEVDKLMLVSQRIWLKFYQVGDFDGYESLKYDSDNPPRIVVAPDLTLLRKLRQFFALVRVTLIASLQFKEEA